MNDRWQLQEAKNRLSELVRKARDEGATYTFSKSIRSRTGSPCR